MNLRPYLRGGLWAGLLLLVVLLVSAVVSLTLAIAGDRMGSQASLGIALVAIVCLMLDLVTLVVLLALAEITRPAESASDRSASVRPRGGESSQVGSIPE